jgi:hypothetical protein
LKPTYGLLEQIDWLERFCIGLNVYLANVVGVKDSELFRRRAGDVRLADRDEVRPQAADRNLHHVRQHRRGHDAEQKEK